VENGGGGGAEHLPRSVASFVARAGRRQVPLVVFYLYSLTILCPSLSLSLSSRSDDSRAEIYVFL